MSFWDDIDDCTDTHSLCTDITEDRQYESDAESFASSFILPSFSISTQFTTFNSPILDSTLLPWDSHTPPPFTNPPPFNPPTFNAPGLVFRSREVEEAFLSDLGSLGMTVPKGVAERLKIRDGVGPIYTIPSDFTASETSGDEWRPRSVLEIESIDPIVFGDEMEVDPMEIEEENVDGVQVEVVFEDLMEEDEPMLDSAVEVKEEFVGTDKVIPREDDAMESIETEASKEEKSFPCPCGQTFERLCGR
jgi:hypothetical protein